MAQRRQLIEDFERGLFNLSELCRQFGVSRKTAYKWLERYREGGEQALADRSHAASTCPHRTGAREMAAIVALREKHPRWGPRKLLDWLEDHRPGGAWPARSTTADILRRHGLVRPRRRRPALEHPGKPTTVASEPNRVWTADFKGQFKTGDGWSCYPLTVADRCSRFLLGCQGLESTQHELARPVFRRLFAEFGLPDALRTDNGTPFATTAMGRLSRLSVWWLKLGIRPELIEPAHPEQNGSHERMHRELKAETTRPPAATRRGQQRRFEAFRQEFNEERPHESLGGIPPARIYRPSPRPLPHRTPKIEYPGHFEVRRVSRNGGIRWKSAWVNVSHVLLEEDVGLEEVADGIWNLYFGPLLLGRFDERERWLYGARYR